MTASQKLLYKVLIVALIFLIILGYSLFQARHLISGPNIVMFTPKNGENLANPLVMISGSASNIVEISLDDRQIYVDKQGNFSEKLLVSPGYNIIKLEAQDRFGRTIQKIIELNYTAKVSSSTVEGKTASTTATSTIIQ